MGSKPGRAIPKALKMIPATTLLGAQHYKVSTGFSSPHKCRTTNTTSLKIKKSETVPIIISVCIHRRTVWNIGSHTKYVIFLKYREFTTFWEAHPALYNKPRCEKNGLRGFRPDPAQTVLYNHKRWLEA